MSHRGHVRYHVTWRERKRTSGLKKNGGRVIIVGIAHCSPSRRPGLVQGTGPKRTHCLGFRILRLVKSADMSSMRPWWQTLSLPLLLPTNLKSNLDEPENPSLKKPGNHLLPWNAPSASTALPTPSLGSTRSSDRYTLADPPHPLVVLARRPQQFSCLSRSTGILRSSPFPLCLRVDPRSAKFSFSSLAPLFLFHFKHRHLRDTLLPISAFVILPRSLSSTLSHCTV